MVRDAIDNGWESVMLDMSQKSLAENIAGVNKLHTYARSKTHRPYVEAYDLVKYAKSQNPASPSWCTVPAGCQMRL